MESVQSNRGRPQRSHTANGYWSHLKLLLWKNYTVKKRQPVTVICEILAPLVVFLIIIGVRSNQLGFPVTTEYNQAMPLPSAGWIPMLQFFCPEVSSDQYGFPDYENTRVSEILEFLSTSSDEHSTLNLHNIQQMMSSLEKSNENETQQIPESLNNASSPVKTFLSNPFIQLMLKQVFTSFTAKAKPHLKQFLEMTKELDSLIPVSDSCDLYPNVTGRNLTDQDREDGNPEPSQDEYIVVDPDTDFKVPKQRTILFVKLWNSLQSVMCGINNTVNETVFNDPDWIHKMGFTDTQLVKFKLMAFLLLRGRPVILYAPNTTDVNQVIEKANETMKALDSITKSSEILFNVSVELTELLQQNVTQELYQTDDNSQSSLYDSGVGWLRDLLMIGDREDLQQMADSLAKVTCIWNSLMSKVNLNLFQPFVDEKSMARYSAEADRSDNITVIAGLVFETNTEGQLPAHVTYKVKLNGTYAPYTYFIQQKIPLQYHEHDYSLEHLLFPFVQDVVERAIIEQKVGKTVIEPGGYIREFPYACHVQDYFQYKVGHSLVVFLTFIWIYYILTITQTVVHEKEDRLKEMMKIMGLSNFIYWLSWFLTNLIQMSVTVTLLVVILKYGQIYQYSNLFLLWVFTMLFAVSSILLCFFLSVFFSKARIAASSSGIIYFLTTLPYFYIQNLENASHLTITLPYKILSCLPSPSAYGLGMRYILMHELQMVGLQWSTINAPWPEYNQDLSVCQVMLFMVFDCFIYVLLMWYIEAVYPGSYGVPQPWYFPFLKSYWCDCQSVDVTDGQDSDLSSLYRQDGCVRLNDILATEDPDSQIEDEPRNQDIGVHINRLVKVYDTGKVKAVNGLSLNLYEDQITALLGHNGAGKTTIMSILTGFITPTSGTAIINGKDIRREMVQIRQSLGICPQYNALFDKLTVQEHLWFYGRLKGVDMKNYKAELQGLLKDVGLRNKKHNTIKTLSGGMKRKLSIAVAFTGGAKTVILDEPTAGVDPYARRAIWDLLQKYKQGRTILLSTHHMDEASLLGDRIAILAKGQLKCCGSSQYLKTNLGDGYKLTIVKEKEMRELVDEDVDSICQEEPKPWSTFSSSKVTLLIQDYIPSAELITENENELVYLIPVKNIQKSSFIELFDALSNDKERFGISSFGMTETTLEQIFLQVTQDERIEANVNGAKECTGGNEGITTLSTTNSMTLEMPQDSDDDQVLILEDDVDNGCGSNGKAKTKCTAISLICLGLVIKRLQYTKRDVKTLFSQLLLPVVFIMLAIGIATMTFNIQTDSSLTMTTSMYISDTMYVPYTNEMNALQEDVPTDEFDEIFVDKLIETLYYPAGLGATCLLSSPFNSTLDGLLRTNTSIELSSKDFNQICQKTVPESLRVTFPYMESQPPVSFSANSSEGTCYNSPVMENPGDMKTIDVPSYQVISGDIVQNLTDKNMIQYLLQTRDQYALERYGALSFGGIRTFVPKDFNRNLNVSSPFRRLATRNTAAAWYVMDSQQSIAVYVNLINNAILRANVDPSSHGNPSAYGITVINEPIQTENSLILDFVHRCIFLQVAIFILLGMSFIPASVMVFLVSERASKAKHLHFISGVSPFVYWISNYVWDMLMFLLPVACCVVVLLVFDVPVFSTSTNLPALVALFILFGWSVIPMMYPASFLFDVPNNAYVMLLVFNMFLGFGTTVGMFFIQNLGSGQVMISLGNVLDKVLVFFPHYCLGHGLVQLSFYDMLNTFYKQIGEYEKVRHPFEWDILSHMLVVMAIEGFVFLGFTLLCEYGYFSRFKRKSGLKSVQQYSIIEGEEDGDVVQERQRVLRESDQDVLRLLNLTKVYDVKKKKKSLTNSLLAVDKICLGVPQGQCFGLLGINGAGKTTLFQMLTGDKSITSGDAYLHGYSIAKNVREAYKHMGYCPQYDTLYDKLTGREHLYLYTRLHGIPARQRKEVVDSTLERLNLLQYADRLAGTYSGGNKRKLSTAISLIGNPSVIFMDEPTSGMDPQSKRFLWNVIHDVVKSGTSVIFTSHSMEECENLCSRLAIMVNGQFKCIGSIQHLKSKFGDGYTITIIPNKNQPKEQQIKSLFQHEFPESVLKDCHFNMVQFELKSRSLSDIFSKLEGMKETLDIEDYSVRQTTLDDVFVNFAKKQHKSSYVQQKSMEEIQDQETVTQGTTDLTNLVQLQTLPATVV